MKTENIVEMSRYQPRAENSSGAISKELETAIKNLIEKMRENEEINYTTSN